MNTTIFKGYPFGLPKSMELFPHKMRPTGQQIEEAMKDDLMVPVSFVDQYSRALHEAEKQIEDIQADYPFLPEDYGFYQPNEYQYISKWKSHDDNVVLTRISDHIWSIEARTRLIKLTDGGSPVRDNDFNHHNVINIYNEREMYMYFKINGLLESIKLENTGDEIPEGPGIEAAIYGNHTESVKEVLWITSKPGIFKRIGKWFKKIYQAFVDNWRKANPELSNSTYIKNEE